MNDHIDRRAFVKRCIATAAGAIAATSASKAFFGNEPPADHQLCTVVGDAYFDNTIRAVEALGGMRAFVQRGSTVGLLINSPFGSQGTYANPDIALAVVKMCLDAGAKQIVALNDIGRRYWQRSALHRKMQSEVGLIRYADEMTEVKIEKGKSLKEADISNALLSCDAFVNIPIIKDHAGTRFTGNLKNMMGACSSSTCRYFHYGGSVLNIFKGGYQNPELLAQCIADVSLVRRPNLCVVDATEILATNGPSGPGEIKKPREVIASTNCLAADMYAVRHLGLNWEELPVIRFAQQHGYGPRSLREVKIQAF
jgi:uncharacterized protein (DUF362 family)